MKYHLYSNGKVILSVTLSPYQAAHMSTKGFAFGKKILMLANDSPSLNVDYVTIEDENNRIALIRETSVDFKRCLTSGARYESAQNTDAQLRHLGFMDSIEA